MSVYGNATTMAQLLTAMRDGAKQDTASLSYLRNVYVAYPPLIAFTAEPCIFLIPLGAPEEQIGESRLRRAKLTVAVQALVYTTAPERETLLLGNNREVGLLQFVDDVMEFYDNNTLSLSGLEANIAPTIVAGADAYTIEPTEDDKFAVVCRLDYEATTKPFEK